MLTAFVMLNVVVMNFCFDIPVKLFSSILLLASLVLLAADASRLVNFFVRDKPVDARAEPGPVFRRRWLRMRSEEHTSELQSLMRSSYAVFCWQKQPTHNQ